MLHEAQEINKMVMDFKELEFDSLDFELISRCENDEISSSNVL